ncbi:MarR family winged helix-turn-helix transcriptional regulator [Heliophilum fasciatum]|uniref:HTH-type transcriptional regulator MgrA n=1 Tax=Heliophilum fasciatum TaxID=35700 RepID=A0A4R2RE64_9FIRM|nr:MarR family transcriptional regulator [Heliophilum fasciatum]MCW2278968.1 DNA-binding MarR family transcriptional regulator [Heliophilum fasciatum]TCP61782.1 DNA-binding MarR family transcriptional regulator [Heliophilum fasciatum]
MGSFEVNERELTRAAQGFFSIGMRIMAEMSQRTDLTYTQFAIIHYISYCGLALQKDMRKQFHLTQGALSTALKDLEAQDLISRTQSPVDQREWVISLTAKGEAILDEVGSAKSKRFHNMVQKDPEAAKQFVDAINWFIINYNRENKDINE